ncbi:hypothetical protein ACTXG6_03585 [Pseudonocardia sp. Cha107L01]
MALRSGLAMSELSPRRLWHDYLALGGSRFRHHRLTHDENW